VESGIQQSMDAYCIFSISCQPFLACLDRYAQYPDGLRSPDWHPPGITDTGHIILVVLYGLVDGNSMGTVSRRLQFEEIGAEWMWQ
jgi:hypothetical protein